MVRRRGRGVASRVLVARSTEPMSGSSRNVIVSAMRGTDVGNMFG